MNVERHIVHGANFSLGARAEHRLAQRKNFRQIADFNERHRRDVEGHEFTRAATCRNLECALAPEVSSVSCGRERPARAAAFQNQKRNLSG